MAMSQQRRRSEGRRCPAMWSTNQGLLASNRWPQGFQAYAVRTPLPMSAPSGALAAPADQTTSTPWGDNGVLVHFNGIRWTQLAAPGALNGSENFSGILTLSDGQMLISASGTEGRRLHGTARGLIEIIQTPLALISMTGLGDRVLFSTNNGVAELFGRDIRVIKSTFATATALPGRGRAFFIEPTQDVPSYIQYGPQSTDHPWIRRKH